MSERASFSSAMVKTYGVVAPPLEPVVPPLLLDAVEPLVPLLLLDAVEPVLPLLLLDAVEPVLPLELLVDPGEPVLEPLLDDELDDELPEDPAVELLEEEEALEPVEPLLAPWVELDDVVPLASSGPPPQPTARSAASAPTTARA